MKKEFFILLTILIMATLLAACSSEPVPPPTRAADATPNCDKGFSHLGIGQYATVLQVGHPNRVRSTPHVANDNIIGVISSGQYGKIVDGPVCQDGLIFWKLEGNSIPSGSGWSAEGDGTTHWLEPYTP